MRPIVGKKGASLGIKHARFEQKDGEKHTIAEFNFDEDELNRAAINIDNILSEPEEVIEDTEEENQPKIFNEVMLFFEQASRKPGKEKGRTGDRGVVPDVSDKPVAVYFRSSIHDLKEQMVRGDVNPLTEAFIVDVHVQRIGGEVKAYIVTNVHSVVSIEDD